MSSRSKDAFSMQYFVKNQNIWLKATSHTQADRKVTGTTESAVVIAEIPDPYEQSRPDPPDTTPLQTSTANPFDDDPFFTSGTTVENPANVEFVSFCVNHNHTSLFLVSYDYAYNFRWSLGNQILVLYLKGIYFYRMV